jgi:hypothetical protein
VTSVTGGTKIMSNPVIQMPSGNVALPRGRLIFAVDATASREKTWTIARDLQSKMFLEAGSIGTLNLQLIYYGGESCRVSPWMSSGEELARSMNKVQCAGGMTQIERVLKHALREHAKAPVQAMTFIGDAMEEDLDLLASLAGELGAAGVPLHMFQEGNNASVRKAFRLMALKTGGTYSAFNAAVPETIARLSSQLNDVARVAVASVAAIGHDRS